MKIRTGFVSNSSSSSFILFFDKYPSKEYLAELMGNWDDANIQSEEVVTEVWNSINDNIQEITDNTFIYEYIYPHDDTKIDLSEIKYSFIRYENMDKVSDIDFFNKLKETINISTRKYVTSIDFSDNDGNYYAQLEHGDIFRNMDHFSISHH